MNYEIRRLRPEELGAALALAWEVFLEYEAPDYGPEGVETFRREVLESEAFQAACRRGENRMWGAFDGAKLVGLFVMRGPAHICLAFTHGSYHRRGIATAIFHRLLEDLHRENPEVRRLSLNSSPCGRPFYRHLGFADTEKERTMDGIRFTPMACEIGETI